MLSDLWIIVNINTKFRKLNRYNRFLYQCFCLDLCRNGRFIIRDILYFAKSIHSKDLTNCVKAQMTFSGKPLPVVGMASVQYSQPFLARNKAITDNKVFCISLKFCNLAVLLTIVWIHLPTNNMHHVQLLHDYLS